MEIEFNLKLSMLDIFTQYKYNNIETETYLVLIDEIGNKKLKKQNVI